VRNEISLNIQEVWSFSQTSN